jgi:hypothetical protein
MTTGIRFIEETPELVPRHEASFYGHIDNYIGINPFEYVNDIAGFGFLLSYPEWKYPSPWLAEQPLPQEVALLWRYEVMTAPPQAFAPFVRDLRVTNDKLIPLIPDFCGWANLGIISERACCCWNRCFPVPAISGRRASFRKAARRLTVRCSTGCSATRSPF